MDSILKRSEMYKSEKPVSEPGSEGTKDPSSLVLMHGALPMLGSYARQILGERKKEAHDEHIRKQFDQLIQKSEQLRAEWEQEERKAAEKAGKNGSAKSGSRYEQSGQHKQSEKTDKNDKKEQTEQTGQNKQPKQTEQSEQSEQNNVPEKEAELTPLQKEIRKTGHTVTELRMSLMREAGARGEADQVMQISGDPPEKLLERWRRYFRPEKEKHPDKHYKRKKVKKKLRR